GTLASAKATMALSRARRMRSMTDRGSHATAMASWRRTTLPITLIAERVISRPRLAGKRAEPRQRGPACDTYEFPCLRGVDGSREQEVRDEEGVPCGGGGDRIGRGPGDRPNGE